MAAKIRAILLVCVGLFLVHANGLDLSREDYLTYKRHLKRVNKPAVKTIRTKEGDIYDCVDIYKQLAFDNPLLKNHTIPVNPILPKSSKPEMSSADRASLLKRLREVLDGGCPEGSVPIRRTLMQDLIRAPSLFLHGRKYPGNVTFEGDTLHPQVRDNPQDHHYAVIQARWVSFYGTKAAFNLWNPRVPSINHFSLAQMWVSAGAPPAENIIEVGWTVYPYLYGDDLTRLFIYWTADGYVNTGCYNVQRVGYVHTNPYIPIGVQFERVSIFNGAQYSTTLQTVREPNSGNWLLLWDESDVQLGYFPRAVVPALGNGPSTRIDWGGETRTPNNVPPFPPMGSGHFPSEGGSGQVAYVRWIRVVNTSGYLVDGPLSTISVQDKPSCYKVDDPRILFGGDVGRAFYYGGPGGNC